MSDSERQIVAAAALMAQRASETERERRHDDRLSWVVNRMCGAADDATLLADAGEDLATLRRVILDAMVLGAQALELLSENRRR